MAIVKSIIARRWFEKTNGNTYHTVELALDNDLTIKSPRAYGYGDQWTRTARGLARQHNVVMLDKTIWDAVVLEVKRKKDL